VTAFPVYRKRCPECGRDFTKGRAARYCDPCRKKLKAWRRRQRREVARAKLGLHPRWKAARLKLGRMKPTAATRNRYRTTTCADCGVTFLGGARAVRCIPCNDSHRRDYQRIRDAGRTRQGRDDAPATHAART
jgi:hypothetical protein